MSDYGSQADARNASDEELLSAQRAEERKRAASNLIHGFYRLVKACMLHSETNQAVQSLLPVAVSAVGDFCQAAQTDAAVILFAGETVFIGAQILRASRETYGVAQELGAYLETVGATELTFERGITNSNIGVFARRLAEAQRDRNVAAGLLDSNLPGVRLRRVTGMQGDGPLELDDSPVARVGRTYAAAILIVRSLYADLRRGETRLPQRVKRVAQKLVALAEEDPRLLVALATSPSAEGDMAAIAVNSAILCLMLVRQLTTDRMTLATITMTALLYDSARVRLTTSAETAVTRNLNDAEADALPASAVVAFTALGRLHGPSLPRAVVAYEAYYLQRSARLGPVYRGLRQPTVLSRILATARTFAELRVPVKGGAPLRLDDVIQLLSNRCTDATERTYVKLLLGALGFFPTGSLVELSTGEMAVVMAAPERPVDFARPPVRVLYDEGGNLLEEPFDIDLAAPARKGAPLRVIRRPIDAGDQEMKAMRAFAMAAIAQKPAPSASATPRPTQTKPAQRSQVLAPEVQAPARKPAANEARAANEGWSPEPARPAAREPIPFDPEPLLPLESLAVVQGPPLHDQDETTLTGPLETPDLAPDPVLEDARRSYMQGRGADVTAARGEVRQGSPERAPAQASPAAQRPAARAAEPGITVQRPSTEPSPRSPSRVSRPLIPRDETDGPPPQARPGGEPPPRQARPGGEPPPRQARPGGEPPPRQPQAATPAPRRSDALGSYSVAQPRKSASPEASPAPPAARPAAKPAAPALRPAPLLTDTDKLLAAYLSEGAVDIASISSIKRPPNEPSRPEPPKRPAAPTAREPARPAPGAARTSPQAPPSPSPVASPTRERSVPATASRPLIPREEAGATRPAPAPEKPSRTPAYGMAPVRPAAKPSTPLPREEEAPPSVAPTRMIQWSQGAPAIPPPPASSDHGPISVPPPSGVPTRHFDWNQEALLEQEAGPITPRATAAEAPAESEPVPPSRNPTRAFQWARDAGPATAPPPPTAPNPGSPLSEPPPSFHPTRAIKWASTEAFLAGLESLPAGDGDDE